MVDFTRQIDTLERQAASTPQVRPATGNVVADVASLASVGLQAFQQNRAREQLEQLRAAELEQQENTAQGILGLRELRQSLVNQGVSRTTLQQKEAEYLNQFSSSTQLEIIGGAKKITGETLSTFSDELTQQQKERRALEQMTAELTPFMTEVPAAGATDEELSRSIVQANQAKAAFDKRQADERLLAAQLGNEESLRRLDARNFASSYMAQVGYADSQRMSAAVRTVDSKSPEATSALLTDLQSMRASLVPDLIQQAANQGIIITEDEANAQVGSLLAIYDTLEGQLLQDDTRKMGDNQFRLFSQGLFNDLLTSDNPEEQKAARMIGLMEFANLQDVGGQLISGYLTTIANGYNQSIQDGINKGTVDDAIHKANNLEKSAPSDVQQTYTDALLADLDGPRKRREEFMKSGFVTHIEAMANGTPEYALYPDEMDDVAEGFLEMSGDFINRSIAEMLNNPQLVSVERARQTDARGRTVVKKGPPIETAQGAQALVINEDLTVSSPAGDFYLSPTAKRYNKFIRNVFVALPKLGIEDSEIQELQSRIVRTYQTSPVEEE